MKKAILATKVGMTQIFDENGVLIPVTVLQAGPCVVTQVKTVDNDGYKAVQVGFVDKRDKLVNKPQKGHFDKAGVSYKRYGQSRGPMAHGSKFHRHQGSNGSATTPGRVFKGKGMPGQMGNKQITIQNLEVVKVDTENNLLLIKGAVPGPKKSLVTIKETVKVER